MYGLMKLLRISVKYKSFGISNSALYFHPWYHHPRSDNHRGNPCSCFHFTHTCTHHLFYLPPSISFSPISLSRDYFCFFIFVFFYCAPFFLCILDLAQSQFQASLYISLYLRLCVFFLIFLKIYDTLYSTQQCANKCSHRSLDRTPPHPPRLDR